MKIYRIETEAGLGAYHACVINYAPHRPRPDEDGINWYSQGHYFGFKSLEQLYTWFEDAEEILYLKLHYLDIYEYEVDEVYVLFGYSQVVFMEMYANRIRKIEWMDIENPATEGERTQETI